MWTGEGGQANHGRATSSMPTMLPGEPAEEPLLRIVRRPANERRATRHAPGAQPCPCQSRLALQARPCGQGAGGGRGGPGCRGRTVLATTQDRHRRAVLAACRPRRRLRPPRADISSARAWKKSSSRRGRFPTAGSSRGERSEFFTTGLTGRRR
jgi:hypothetical protein